MNCENELKGRGICRRYISLTPLLPLLRGGIKPVGKPVPAMHVKPNRTSSRCLSTWILRVRWSPLAARRPAGVRLSRSSAIAGCKPVRTSQEASHLCPIAVALTLTKRKAKVGDDQRGICPEGRREFEAGGSQRYFLLGSDCRDQRAISAA